MTTYKNYSYTEMSNQPVSADKPQGLRLTLSYPYKR